MFYSIHKAGNRCGRRAGITGKIRYPTFKEGFKDYNRSISKVLSPTLKKQLILDFSIIRDRLIYPITTPTLY